MLASLKTKYKLILGVILFFIALAVSGLFLHEKILEKERISEHIQAHIDMPGAAMKMQIFFDKALDAMASVSACMDDAAAFRMSEITYRETLIQFKGAVDEFDDMVARHNEKWGYIQEESVGDREHEEIRRLNVAAEIAMKNNQAQIENRMNDFFALMRNGSLDDARTLFENDIKSLIEEGQGANDAFIGLQERESQFHAAELKAIRNLVDTAVVIASLSVVFFIVLAVFLLLHFILNPLERYVLAVEKISSGDLSRRIKIDGAGAEVGRLVAKFNEMADSVFSSQRKLEKANAMLQQEKMILSESEKKFYNLTSLSPDCIKIIGTNGLIEYMNPGGLKEHNFKNLDEAIGWDFIESVEDYQRDYARKMLQSCLFEGKSAQFDVEHKHGTADREWCNLSMMPIKNDSGKISGVLAVSRDISYLKNNLSVLEGEIRDAEQVKKAMINLLEDFNLEKEQTKREKDKIDKILQSIGDGVFVVDKEYNVLIFNEMASQLSGCDSRDVIGSRYDKCMSFVVEQASGVDKGGFVKEIMLDGNIMKLPENTVLLTKKGVKLPVSVSVAPLKDDEQEVIGAIVVFRDVTKEREIDKAKNEFVSLASHQLRTPLTAINWYVEMMINGDAGEINEEQKSYLEEVAKGSRRMVDLVNALLNVSRIDLGTFAVEPEPTDFPSVSRDVLVELKPSILKKKMKIKEMYEQDLPKINADPKLVRIIFQNILSNAVKYTPEKGKIEIEIKKDKKDIQIRIADNGYGIPKLQQEHIFEKLFRADNARQKETDGTGLGLYMIKSIVEKSGGKVWFESVENEGTTFFVKLPLSGMNKKEGTKGLGAA